LSINRNRFKQNKTAYTILFNLEKSAPLGQACPVLRESETVGYVAKAVKLKVTKV